MNFSDVLSNTFCKSTIYGTLGFGLGYISTERPNFVARMKGLPVTSKINSYHCGLALAVSVVSLIVLTNFIRYHCRNDPSGPRTYALYTGTVLSVGIASTYALHSLGLHSDTTASIQILLTALAVGLLATATLFLALGRSLMRGSYGNIQANRQQAPANPQQPAQVVVVT